MPSAANKYAETIEYLYGLQKHGIKLGLSNPERLLKILGTPHDSFRSVHIAGTNGKGSTAAMIASILKSSGLRVGLFTSPHLVSFTERIKTNGSPIAGSDVVKLTNLIRAAIADTDLNPTFFEFVTAMAFCYFERENIEWAVVEVGMGGRLDATNVLLPDVSVITNIGLDHAEFLGRSLHDIASEKAGIIKPSVPVVTAASNPGAFSVIENTSQSRGSGIHAYDRDFASTLVSMDQRHIEFNYKSLNLPSDSRGVPWEFSGLSAPVTGRHQLINASLAIRACEILNIKGLQLHRKTVIDGLANMHSEGRLELINQDPPFYIDSAHNPEAAKALARTVGEIFPSQKIILITGVMKDKDIKGMVRPLMQMTDTIILTRPQGERAASPADIKKHIMSSGGRNGMKTEKLSLFTAGSVGEAVELAKRIWKRDCVILATGSFYTTGEVKEYLFSSDSRWAHLRE
jgi:dihydrofolate synthase/folylpolyglutamate synthase